MSTSREAFVTEPPERQLGALAASLARLSSSARSAARVGIIVPMLTECIQFIEWTAWHVSPEIAAELVDLQIMLGIWRKAWPEASLNNTQRILLSFQARKWSDQVLDYSGLLVTH